MFDELRQAWHEAVSNFWEELNAEAADPEQRLAAMNAEMAEARRELSELERELRETETRLGRNRHDLEVCERRERMARQIGDDETAALAAEYAARHGERIRVFERKVAALRAERELWRRDLDRMETALRNRRVERGETGAASSGDALLDELDEAARERSAEERLEELKRRMGRR